MSRVKFVAGNWKMNTTKAAATALAKAVGAGAPAGVAVGVAPPFVYLDAVGQSLAGSSVLLGAQDVYFEKNGAFTGEISVEMLKDLGVKFCLAGHSERRHVFKESSELVGKKAAAIYAGGLTLIHCVGEKLDERDGNQTLAVVAAQLKELNPGAITDPDRLVIAYEPVWAIGTGRNATDAQAQEVHVFIRQTLGKMWNNDFAARVRIQYGGSMKPENAKGLLAQPDVDGGLIGGAALKAESFFGNRIGWKITEQFMTYFFFTAMVLFIAICAILILLVLIQKGRGGGLSGAFGGAGGNTAFGTKTGDVLTWATSIVFGVFLILAVALNLVADNVGRGSTNTTNVTLPGSPAAPSGGSGSPTTMPGQ